MRWFGFAAKMNIADGTPGCLRLIRIILMADAAAGYNSPTVMRAANYTFSRAAMIAAPPDERDVLGNAGRNALCGCCRCRRSCQHGEKSGADRGDEKRFHCHAPTGLNFGIGNVVAQTGNERIDSPCYHKLFKRKAMIDFKSVAPISFSYGRDGYCAGRIASARRHL